MSDADEIPAFTEITLDRDTLHWKDALRLPALPTGFRIFTGYSISYLMTVRDIESGEEGETLFANETSLNVSQVLDDCRRQTFTIEILVNDTQSGQSSSYITTPEGVCSGNDSTLGQLPEGKEYSHRNEMRPVHFFSCRVLSCTRSTK